MSKKKLLYISSHLSTGGMPQYLLKQIQTFKKDFDIEVIEVSNHSGGVFVVQKDQINDLVKLHTLGDDKSEMIDLIKSIKPTIIHFTEIPEHFISTDILNKLWDSNRKYNIVVSTHGSGTNPNEIRYQPDRYVLVSEWSRRKFEHLGVDTKVWEYPIEAQSFNKVEVQKELGFDSSWKHVLMVGLFTEGKNQGEIFNVARILEKYKIKFHFVGNQAINFKDYWGPIMEHKPDNCIVWGERSDVDLFYKASDMFYFSSKLELNPLSIKEALGYGLICILRKLDTYLDTYDSNELVTYIDNDIDFTKKTIIELMEPEFNEIPGWFSYSGLYDRMVNNFNDGASFVEVGSWLGKSSNYMVSEITKSKKNIEFTAIDTFKGTENEELHKNIVGLYGGDIYGEFVENTIISDNYALFNSIKDTSKNASTQFQNDSIDFIMIDAGHNYDSVKSDISRWYHKVKPGGFITGDGYGVFKEVNQAVDEFFYKKILIDKDSFVRKKPKIQIKHLMTKPNDLRERISQESLKQLRSYGMDYEAIVNTPYTDKPPIEHCKRPEHISPTNTPGELYPGAGLGYITGGHYGCYMAHRFALETINPEYDYTLIFEADAYIHSGLMEFVEAIHKACFISERDNVPFISFADNPSRSKEKIDDMFSRTAHNQDLAHAYLIPNREKQWWLDRISDCEWDVADLWYNHVFYHHQRPRYTTNKMYSNQAEGFSLLDLTNKTWK